MSREEIDQANNVLQTVEHQLAKAVASRDLARLDLERTVIRAPADGWVTNLNVYTGEFITRGSTAVALVKENTFYVMAYLEETKLEGVRPGYRAEITPLGSSKTIKGTVDSIAAGVTNASSSSDSKGMASVDSNLEWVRLAQRVPDRYRGTACRYRPAPRRQAARRSAHAARRRRRSGPAALFHKECVPRQ